MDSTYDHMISIMLEASAALMALSFLAIPLKITSTIESDPLDLRGEYPRIVKKFCIQAICEVCFSTSMLFALSMYVVLFAVARGTPFFAIVSLPFLSLIGFFLARRVIFFDSLFGAKQLQGPVTQDDYIIEDQRAVDAIEKSAGSQAWRIIGFAAVVLSLGLLALFLAVNVFDLLGAALVPDWSGSFARSLQYAAAPLWTLFVMLGLVFVFIDHAFEDRLILHWKMFQRAMEKYATDVHNRFQQKVVACDVDIRRLIDDTTKDKDGLLLQALPALPNLKPQESGLGSLMPPEGLTVQKSLFMLKLELAHIESEDNKLFFHLSGNWLQNLSGQLRPFRERSAKLNMIETVLKEIESWRTA
jgi:hypothetical protein